MEKQRTNNGPLKESADKHSIYTPFGVESVLTNDLRMKDRYVHGFPRIEARFARMIRQLKAPYQQATLPDVVSAEELWGHIAL